MRCSNMRNSIRSDKRHVDTNITSDDVFSSEIVVDLIKSQTRGHCCTPWWLVPFDFICFNARLFSFSQESRRIRNRNNRYMSRLELDNNRRNSIQENYSEIENPFQKSSLCRRISEEWFKNFTKSYS